MHVFTHTYMEDPNTRSQFLKRKTILLFVHTTHVTSDDKALREESLTEKNQKQQILKLKIE